MRRRLRKKLERQILRQRFENLAALVIEQARHFHQPWVEEPDNELRRRAHLTLIFCVDMEAYSETGHSITGMNWRKTHHGVEPVYPAFPRKGKPVILDRERREP